MPRLLPPCALLLRLLSIALFCLAAGGAAAAEYFVSKQGDDTHDGRTPAQAFATFQKGVDALAPGDVLTIAPGEYRESVVSKGLGSAKVETRLRAALPGTVLLRGSEPLGPVKKTEGYRYVHHGAVAKRPGALLEEDTLRTLVPVLALRDVEISPGTYFYDASAGRLYFSTTDFQPPQTHRYSISTRDRPGLELRDPVRVVVEGLAATGYYQPGPIRHNEQIMGGIALRNPRQCIVRDCVAYLNVNGIYLFKGEGNRVEACETYGNGGVYGGEGGEIVRLFPKNDVIERCVSYRSRERGQRFYLEFTGDALLKGNIVWGSRVGDFWLKGRNAAQYGRMEGCVSFGYVAAVQVNRNLIGGRNFYNSGMSPDNVSLAPAQFERHFADPLNLDFRWQEDSPLRKEGAGPIPYTPHVYYLSPKGDDGASGLSTRRAWRTPGHALERLKPGDTLYLLEGKYELAAPLRLRGTKAAPIALRGRGDAVVALSGAATLEGCEWLALERLVFSGPVSVEGGGELAFRRCLFTAPEKALAVADAWAVSLRHCEFPGEEAAALRVSSTKGLLLTGNLFNRTSGPAVELDDLAALRYSDYNHYRDPAAAWSVGGKPRSLAQIRPGHERYAATLRPEYREEGGRPVLANPGPFLAAGPLGKPLGAAPMMRREALHLSGPRLHSATDTTANIEWITSNPAWCEIAWGDTPECENRRRVRVDGFGSWSLTGLEPGQPYYFRILSVAPEENELWSPQPLHLQSAEPLAFTTATEPRPAVTRYVAPDGDDAADGLTRTTAWRSVARAAAEGGPGDLILIAGGEYTEWVPLRFTGEKGRPVTFRAVPGEKPVFTGSEGRLAGTVFAAMGKHALRFEGLYFRQLLYASEFMGKPLGMDAAIALYACEGVEIGRCFNNGFGSGRPAGLLAAWETQGLTLRNSVLAGGWYGLKLMGCSQVLIEHNVFLRNFIQALTLTGQEKGAIVRRNIITDGVLIKARTALIALGHPTNLKQEENLYHFRLTDAEKRPFDIWGQESRRMTLAEFQSERGADGSFIADPGFSGDPGGDGFAADRLIRRPDLDFTDLLPTQPEAVALGIGLEPEAFPSTAATP